MQSYTKSDIARLLLTWEDLHNQITTLETEITNAVLDLGETLVAGNVRATYRSPRRSFDYERACEYATPDQIARHTHTTIRTDWRTLALETLRLEQDRIPHSFSDPSVSIRIQS